MVALGISESDLYDESSMKSERGKFRAIAYATVLGRSGWGDIFLQPVWPGAGEPRRLRQVYLSSSLAMGGRLRR